MSAVRIAAELIRRAVVEEVYAQDLQDGIDGDATAFEGLVHAVIDERDLAWLAPSDWLWFALWRQAQGGPLDASLIAYLEQALYARSARFDLRALVMRDPLAEEEAAAERQEGRLVESVGLQWLSEHAHRFSDTLEVARDALQIATEPAWFTLRELTSSERPQALAVREQLLLFAEQREISHEIVSSWFREGPPLG